MTLITIGMPVFNDKDFIEESLNSLLKQTYTEFLLIISDDGSTDGSGDICRKYAENDSRITYIRQNSNLGISRNMQFLLSQAKTKYFMWAGDDDLYDPEFIEQHIKALENNKWAVSAFGNCVLINENGGWQSDVIGFDYSHPEKLNRVKNYVRNSTDYFGYGVFRREAIEDVKFPVWWWPNKKTPYNNIYPTLCYYLSIGDYVKISGKVLFFKRIKSEQKTNHVIPGWNNAIKESAAYWIRRINLVYFTIKLLNKSLTFIYLIRITPFLLYYWFWIPSFKQFKIALFSFFRNRIMLPS